MWQVFYDNGNTIRETPEIDWANVEKENITALKLQWEPIDWEPVLKREFAIYQMLFPGQEQWQNLLNLITASIRDYSLHKQGREKSVGRTTANFRRCLESIRAPVEEQYTLAQAKWFDNKNEKDRKKAIYLNNFISKLKALASTIGSYQYQLDKGIILRSEGKKVGFFQHKHHVKGMTKSMGGLLDEMYAQEIGMIYNQAGDYVYVQMDVKSGQFLTGIGNTNKIGLNLEIHGIDMEALPE